MSATVLVVEDCEDDQHLCRRAFKEFDDYFSLKVASSAAAGLASVAERKPDLILLDYNLPDMDGIAFMKKLAASSDTPIPIVMLTGDDSAATAVEAMKHGADDYLVKDTAGRYLKLLPGVVGRVMGAYAQRKQLQESEYKFRLLFESANDCLLLLSLDGRIRDINRIGHERLGYTKAEMLGRGIAEFDAPEFADKVPERFAQIMREGQATFETAHVRKDGTIIPLEVSSRAVELHGEKMLYSVIRDITERKKNEAMLMQHKQVVDTSIDGFWMVDKCGNLLEANAAYAKMSGYSVDELVGMHINQLEAREQAADVEAHIAQVIAQGHGRFETRHRRKDGREIDVEISTNYLAESGRFYVFCRDITQRKLAQLEMLRNQYLLNAAQRLGQLGSWELDLPSGELRWSYEMYRIFEVDPVRFTPSYDNFMSAVHPEDRDKVDRAYTQSLQNHQSYDVVHRLLLADGRIKWVREHGANTFDTSGKALRSMGMSQDITELKQVEEKLLRESESEHRHAELLAQQFGYLLQGSFNEIYMFDAESLRFLLTSEGAEKNLGYSDDELSQFTPMDLHPAFTRDSYEELLAPLRGGERESLLFVTEQRRKDGTTYPVEVRMQLMDAKPPVFMAVVQDITEHRRAEIQTREFTAHLQAVREEEKARFAREIHDELGGTLIALKMDASWLSGKLSETAGMPALQECAKSMSVSLDNMVVATRRIISDMRPAILDDIGLLGAIKWQSAQFQQRTGIECRTECVDDGGHSCEKGMDKTFSINLFRIVQESLTNVVRHSDATKVGIRLHCRAAEVVLTVCDNGQGLSQGHTIAPTSHGLRGMCERARQLGGKITFDTPPGGGFSVTVVLPLPGANKQ